MHVIIFNLLDKAKQNTMYMHTYIYDIYVYIYDIYICVCVCMCLYILFNSTSGDVRRLGQIIAVLL